MQSQRSRILVRTTATLAIAVLLGSLWTLRRPLQEAWLLRRLEHGDASERDRAAARLGELESIRAIPLLFREFADANPWSAEPANFNRLIWIAEEFRSVSVLGELFGEQTAFRALTRIMEARGVGLRATPYLRAELGRSNLWACYLALRLIGRVGTPDEATMASVRRASNHESPAIRKAAQHTLDQLGQRNSAAKKSSSTVPTIN